MQWNDDPLKEEKYLIFDAIVEASRKFPSEAWNKISLETLTNCIDKLFEGKDPLSPSDNS